MLSFVIWSEQVTLKLSLIFLKKQKHELRLIFRKDRSPQSKPLICKMNILNVYQINIFQILKLMNKVKDNLNPRA